MQNLRIESLDLEITTKCNLACAYCYIGMAKLKKQMGCIKDMTDEQIEDVFQLIEKYGFTKPMQEELPNGKKRQIKATHIDFYGGEPLVSFERVKYFIEKSKERGMKLTFSLLSNGTNGTKEQFEYLKKNNVWIQRGIDGHPDVQNQYRPNTIEKYLEVSKIIRDFRDSRRMTVNPEWAKDLMKSMEWFEEHGYRRGMSPVPNFYPEWTDEQTNDFKKSLWQLAKYYVERWKDDDPFYIYQFSEEIEGRFMNRRAMGCGGARGLHCVCVDGYIWTCHRFSKEAKDGPYCFGTVKEALAGTAKGYGKDLTDRIEKIKQPMNETNWNEECRYCIAQKTCKKGECMHCNLKCNGDINKPPKLYCELHRETVKIIDWIDNQLRGFDPYWWAKGNTAKGAKQFMNNLKKGQSNKNNNSGCKSCSCPQDKQK